MIPTEEQEREIAAVKADRQQITDALLDMARATERALVSDAPDIDHRMLAGRIDGYVAALRLLNPGHTDWLTIIRTTA